MQNSGASDLKDLAKVFFVVILLWITVIGLAQGCNGSSTEYKTYNDYKNDYYGSEQYQRTGKSYEQKLKDDEYEQELREEVQHRLNRDF